MFSIKKSGIRSATIGSVATLLLCVAVGGGNNLAQAQTPVPQDETGPYRFAGVEKWEGNFAYQGGGAGEEQVSQGRLTWNASQTASGSFTMEGPTFPEGRNAAVWEGPAVGSGSIDTTITLTDHCEEYRRWTGQGAMPGVLGPGDGLKPGPLRARLEIDFDTNEYWFSVSPEGIDTSEYYKLTCPNYSNESTSTFTTMLGGGGFTTGKATAHLPEKGLALDGTVSFEDQLAQMWAISDEGGVVPWTYQWGLQPASKSDVEVVVSPEGFDKWLPEGGTALNRGGIGVGASAPAPAANLRQSSGQGVDIEYSGGNTLTVTARLQATEGGTLKQKARKFMFELLEVSSEPGIAMNAPNVKARQDLLDLEFQQLPNFAVAVRVLDAKKAETTTEGGLTEAKAILSANDFGAWGLLKVTAEMETGQQIVGYLEGDKEQKEIRIPKRKPDSKVADYWKDLYGVGGRADNDDTENAPIGYEGCPGDGLTLYEEYRGFFENGTHMRTKPTRKDFFAVDRIGTVYSKSGIWMFKNATQLEVHGDMLLSEVSDNLVVNFNHAAGPHIVDQHAVQMVSRPSPGMPGAAIKKPGYKGVGTPGTYAWIVIDSGLNPNSEPERYASIVAHELAHTVGVHEHGSGDKQMQWMVWPEDDGTPAVHEISLTDASADAKIITVKREDGTVIPPTSKIFGGDEGVIVTLGVRRGQHSGVEACLMRYDSSWAYVSEDDPNVRYYVQGDEERGTMLCATSVGTGVNDSRREPQSRYGPAGPNRGDCMHQICVSDLMVAPQR